MTHSLCLISITPFFPLQLHSTHRSIPHIGMLLCITIVGHRTKVHTSSSNAGKCVCANPRTHTRTQRTLTLAACVILRALR
jgi:hypothetical protein